MASSGTNFYEWTGGQVTSTFHDDYSEARNRLANHAYNGNFDKALELVEKHSFPNSWRLRTLEEFDTRPPTGWTTLHQIAINQAGTVSHIERLISLGAYRNLRTLDTKETAYDIAKRSGRNREILAALKPVYRRSLDKQVVKNLQRGVDEVMKSRVEELLIENRFRTPPVEVMLELPDPEFWCPIPGFYGGFHIKFIGDNSLEMQSSCRVAGGSGETHVVKPDGTWKRTATGWD